MRQTGVPEVSRLSWRVDRRTGSGQLPSRTRFARRRARARRGNRRHDVRPPRRPRQARRPRGAGLLDRARRAVGRTLDRRAWVRAARPRGRRRGCPLFPGLEATCSDAAARNRRICSSGAFRSRCLPLVASEDEILPGSVRCARSIALSQRDGTWLVNSGPGSQTVSSQAPRGESDTAFAGHAPRCQAPAASALPPHTALGRGTSAGRSDTAYGRHSPLADDEGRATRHPGETVATLVSIGAWAPPPAAP
jgi:hypothetical protein